MNSRSYSFRNRTHPSFCFTVIKLRIFSWSVIWLFYLCIFLKLTLSLLRLQQWVSPHRHLCSNVRLHSGGYTSHNLTTVLSFTYLSFRRGRFLMHLPDKKFGWLMINCVCDVSLTLSESHGAAQTCTSFMRAAQSDNSCQ